MWVKTKSQSGYAEAETPVALARSSPPIVRCVEDACAEVEETELTDILLEDITGTCEV